MQFFVLFARSNFDKYDKNVYYFERNKQQIGLFDGSTCKTY